MKKKYLVLIFLLFCSCYTNSNTKFVNYKEIKKQNSIDIRFNLKAVSGLPDRFSRIKSFESFLTTNKTDPFALGANPFGGGFTFVTNLVSNSATISIPVPDGGPYFAVTAAFDGLSGAINRTNITKPDPNITSANNLWSVSSNSFTYVNGVLAFSDGSSSLKANLNLVPANSLSADVTVTNGAAPPVGVVTAN